MVAVPDLDRKLGKVAAKQHSLIRLSDIEALGGTKSFAAQRVTRGIWVGVARGVYRVAGVPWTYEARVLAAVFAAGSGAVASHQCAARLHGMGFQRAKVTISIRRGQHHRRKGVLVHTSTDLDRADVVMVDGIPTTNPARTLLDIARNVRGIAYLKAIEQARRLELVTWADLTSCLAAHARQGRRGITRLREAVTAGVKRDGLSDTDAELIAYTVLKEHGYDSFVMHHELRDDDGELYADMDLADVDRRINLEIDGPVHRDPTVSRKDARRDSRVRQHGWIVERVPNEIPVFEPKEFLRVVRQALKDADNRPH